MTRHTMHLEPIGVALVLQDRSTGRTVMVSTRDILSAAIVHETDDVVTPYGYVPARTRIDLHARLGSYEVRSAEPTTYAPTGPHGIYLPDLTMAALPDGVHRRMLEDEHGHEGR